MAEYGAEFSTWPYLDATAASLDAADVVKVAFSYGNTLGLFTNFILPDQKDSSKNVINFDTGRFTLDRFSLLNESKKEAREAYVTYGAEVAVLLAKRINPALPDVKPVEAKALFEKILAFEIKMAEVLYNVIVILRIILSFCPVSLTPTNQYAVLHKLRQGRIISKKMFL